jgi:hypothetical protein
MQKRMCPGTGRLENAPFPVAGGRNTNRAEEGARHLAPPT